jgi:hypothetical protein
MTCSASSAEYSSGVTSSRKIGGVVLVTNSSIWSSRMTAGLC